MTNAGQTDSICDAFAAEWRENPRMRAEEFLAERDLVTDVSLLHSLILVEARLRLESARCGVDRGTILHDELQQEVIPDSVAYELTPEPIAVLQAEESVELLEIHDLQIDRYEVRQILGQGGFGIVYRAWDPLLKREVAIKMLRAGVTATEQQRHSLANEAQLISQLEHAHIVPVWNYGWAADGRPFIVSRYVASQDLKTLIRRTPLNFSRSAAICATIARALHHAHTRNIVHRDIKPANILVEPSGHAWLTDFGLGFSAKDETQRDVVGGTAIYMSPEQAELGGEPVNWQSDIFSLGIVFYELLTGVNPLRATSLADVRRLLRESVKPCRLINERVPKPFDDICRVALRQKPEDRFSTALDLAEAIEAAMTYKPRPIPVTEVTIPPTLQGLLETLARNNHDVWAEQRIAEGWQVGDTRDDKLRTHPDLVPYEELPESEKHYDRKTVENTIKAILASGYSLRRSDEV